MPSRWSSGMREDSWRGGFLLSALEMYLKNDMRAKFQFLHDVEAAKGFHASLFTQSTYSGSTTIVPQVAVIDYFKLFSNQTLNDLKRYFQGGTVAAYQHIGKASIHFKWRIHSKRKRFTPSILKLTKSHQFTRLVS